MKTTAFGSFLAFASVGAAFGRTIAVVPTVFGSARGSGRSFARATVIGGAAGLLALFAVLLLGADELPEWTEIPPAVVAVQAGFSVVMQWILGVDQDPSPGGVVGPKPHEMAFALYGLAVLPITALFIVVMTATSLLS